MRDAGFGQLNRVHLRAAWPNEARDFTPWLASEAGLKLLGDAINIELSCEAQEQNVGPFRADIVCRDMESEELVLIENQLERTNHRHLGQVLTYAAGLEAVTIVWVAERFTDEHRAAIDWFNEKTEADISFFGVEVAVLQIDDSLYAPSFKVVCRPNNWSRAVKRAANTGELTEHNQLMIQFWQAFNEHLKDFDSRLKGKKPSAKHTMSFALGRSGFRLAAVMTKKDTANRVFSPQRGVEIVLRNDNAKQSYPALFARKAEIEKTLGFSLLWPEPDDPTVRVIGHREDADFTDPETWSEHFEWLRLRLESLDAVLRPIVREIALETDAGEA